MTEHVRASPEAVWAPVADVTQTHRYSEETFEAEWLDGATAPAVGARFRGHVLRDGRGPIYWALLRRVRGRTNRANMRTTLRRIRSIAEDGRPGP